MTGPDLKTRPGPMQPPWAGPVTGTGRVAGAHVVLSDLSRSTRWGLKGRNAFGWLRANGIEGPDGNNRAARQGDLLILRLSPNEALILALGAGGADALDQIRGRFLAEAPAASYDVPRQDMSIWFRLSGAEAPRIMAELCAVDLRPERFSPGSIAQTSLASQNAIVLRDDRDEDIGFDLLTDFASGAYFWNVLARKVGANMEEIA